MIGAAVGAMVTLAANAALAANAQVVAVLRLVGATDRYIAEAFIRRFTIRAFIGAAVGMIFGMLAVLILPSASDDAGFLTGLGFQGSRVACTFVDPCGGWGRCIDRDAHCLTKSVGGA